MRVAPSADDHLRHLGAPVQNRNANPSPHPSCDPSPNPSLNPNPSADLGPSLGRASSLSPF